MNTYLIECSFCDEESEVVSDAEMSPDYCPFCGNDANAIELDSDEY